MACTNINIIYKCFFRFKKWQFKRGEGVEKKGKKMYDLTKHYQ